MSLKIAITGASGLIGSALVPYLSSLGHHVIQITRRSNLEPKTAFINWNPDSGHIDAQALEGCDVVIHLAGANVGERWDNNYKQQILDSRVKGTSLLCRTLANLTHKPKVLLSSSAVGFYGNHPSHVVLDENSKSGNDFLSDVCQQWERNTDIARDAGIRVVNMRTGVVLSRQGGALKKMWVPFQLGMGGVLGSGEQMMSWIALDEMPRIMVHLINTPTLQGPVNCTAPHPVSNKEFTKVLGQVIKRPTIFPVPAFGVKILFGEMGEVLLLGGNNVVPKRLLDSGYQFKYPYLKEGLEKAVA